MTSTLTSIAPQKQKQQQHRHRQNQKQQHQHLPLFKRRGGDGGQGSFRINRCPQHLLAYSIILVLVLLCWLPDFIVALKDVSVTIPQAVKRGSNAMLTCNYDMENDTLYSVKWYKGRREFYRYTPKENPAMKVFPSQSGLNVERNLSNQSHVVLLAVPLNISGKFTCEISVEAPSFQTAMVSGEMEVVELPEEQATVTGIQPRYRIGDLVDGNCSIKYSKPAANLTWTINGIVVPPHHIKTYQIEKYEETNLESVMSAVHFMVTTQHFIKGQMRLKCTAIIFDIFKEEIESIIEEDRPRIMASGQSYPPDHGYGPHGDGDGYEHNESYLTYFSAPKSSASPSTEFILAKILKQLKLKISINFRLLKTFISGETENVFRKALINTIKYSYDKTNSIEILTTTYCSDMHLTITKSIIIALIISLVSVLLLMQHKQNYLGKSFNRKMAEDKQQMTHNCVERMRQILGKIKENFLAMNLWEKTRHNEEKGQQKQQHENRYQDSNNNDCQGKCGQQQQQQQQYQLDEHCLVANQNVVNVKDFPKDTNITTIQECGKNKTIATAKTAIDCQHHMSQTFAFDTIPSPDAPTMPPTCCALFPLPSVTLSSSCSATALVFSSPFTTSSPPSSSSSSSLLLLSSTLGYRKTYVHDSVPLYAVDASKSNNAKYMSKDQTLLMTYTATAIDAAASSVSVYVALTSNSTYKTPSSFAPLTPASQRALVLESKLLPTSVQPSPPVAGETSMASSVSTLLSSSYSHPASASASVSPSPSSTLSPTISRNNNLMAFIGELLLHQC